MSEKKICPLMYLAEGYKGDDCLEDKCAWWAVDWECEDGPRDGSTYVPNATKIKGCTVKVLAEK